MLSRGKLLVAIVVAASVPSAANAGPRSKKLVPIGNPLTWITPDDYPPDAKRAGQQGRVKIQLAVDSTGKVVSCTIVSSSQVPSVDAKTCEVAMLRGAFDPALDEDGQPMASQYGLAIGWTIPDLNASTDLEGAPTEIDLAQPSEGTVDSVMIVGSTGLVEQCTSTMPSALMAMNYCASRPTGTKVSRGRLREGKPVKTIIHIRSIVMTEYR